MRHHLNSELETIALANEVAESTTVGSCIGLSGDLGVGKSVFARALMRALGVQDAVMPSPTFSLIQTYEGRECHVAHMDWYRLADETEIATLGIREYFSEPWITIIEWPERALQLLPEHSLCIHLSYVPDHFEARELRIDRICKRKC